MKSAMNKSQQLAAALFIMAASLGAAHASKEGVLSLSSFQVSSPGIGESGPVVVSGSRVGDDVKALCVQAFKRTQCLPAEHLSRLTGSMVNGIQISYEAGYRQTGGRTVYVLLSKGFTSARLEGKLISVSESGRITVEDEPGKQ